MSCPEGEPLPAVGGDPVVAARGLAVGYDHRPVVDGIDLELRAGQSLALVGTNGSGKSTLLKTLVGLLGALAGRVAVLGGPPGRQPARVAYVAQFHSTGGLLPLRAGDVVRMGRWPHHGLLGRLGRADRDAVRDAMSRTGVSDLAGVPLRDLSGGQRQRVFLAQALARQADLLVLDEPTAGLDAASRDRYLQVVDEERARGAAVITATHDLGESLRCDVAMLLARRVVATGPPAQVLTPERLLDAFGIALQAVPHGGHTDLVVVDPAHGHDHDPAGGRDHDGGHVHDGGRDQTRSRDHDGLHDRDAPGR